MLFLFTIAVCRIARACGLHVVYIALLIVIMRAGISVFVLEFLRAVYQFPYHEGHLFPIAT